MAIIIHIEDYLDNKPSRVRRPIEDFDKQANTHIPFSGELAELNRQIATHKKETAIIDREIAEYEAEVEEAAKELKTKLSQAGDCDGKD